MKKYTLKCQHCGEMFETSRKNTKYCSDSCRVMASRERKQNIDSEKTSVLVNYSEAEFNQLMQNAKSAGLSIEELVKYRSLITNVEIESNNSEIDTLKKEVAKLKAHLSIYTHKPSEGIFLEADELERDLLEVILAEVLEDDGENYSLEEKIIYVARNYNEK